METENELESCLLVWKDVYSKPRETTEGVGVHLSMEDLYRMAEPGGMDRAAEKAVDHLSLCPACIEEWASWRRAITTLEELEGDEAAPEKAVPDFTYGMKEAAATARPDEPVSIRSSCGRFVLGILPKVNDPEKGMVTLEAVADEEMVVEGKSVMLRDRNGLLLLEGTLCNGRLARLCEDLSRIDLSTWTLVVDGEKE